MAEQATTPQDTLITLVVDEARRFPQRPRLPIPTESPDFAESRQLVASRLVKQFGHDSVHNQIESTIERCLYVAQAAWMLSDENQIPTNELVRQLLKRHAISPGDNSRLSQIVSQVKKLSLSQGPHIATVDPDRGEEGGAGESSSAEVEEGMPGSSRSSGPTALSVPESVQVFNSLAVQLAESADKRVATERETHTKMLDIVREEKGFVIDELKGQIRTAKSTVRSLVVVAVILFVALAATTLLLLQSSGVGRPMVNPAPVSPSDPIAAPTAPAPVPAQTAPPPTSTALPVDPAPSIAPMVTPADSIPHASPDAKPTGGTTPP